MVNGAATPLQPVAPADADAVRAQVRRISASPQFASAGKLYRFLEFVVEETLENPNIPPKEYSIGVSVYGRPAEYDPRTDSIVRVEAGKLRARLAQYYEDAGRDDPVRISVPKGGYVPAFAFREATSTHPALKNDRLNMRPAFWPLIALIGIVIVPVSIWQVHRFTTRAATHYSRLQRISPERHFALDPAPSPDGRSIAYVSDEPGSPYLNIWIHELATGKERRLTRHDANDSSPFFSSDGRSLAFHSDEGGGGIYLVPVAGGQPVLLVARGREPRFSPSGLLLAYWVAEDEETGEFGRAFLLDVGRERGPHLKPDPLFSGFAHVRSPIWSDTGRSLVALGTLQSDVPEKEYDAWTIPINNGHSVGPAVKTGLVPLLFSRGFFQTIAERNRVRAGAWSNGLLYLTIPNGDRSALVRVPLSPSTGRLRGDIESITPGTERFSAPWEVKPGALTFASSRVHYDVWSVPAQNGAASPFTSTDGTILAPSISRDGGAVAWHAILRGQVQAIRVLNVANGSESELARGAVDRPVISPDGLRVAWRVMDRTKQAIVSARIAEPSKIERLCSDCGLPVSWTPDGARILFQTGDPNTAIDALDVSIHKRAPVLSHPSHSLYGARFFPVRGSTSDGWLLFYAATGASTRQIFVTALRNFRASPDARWISITDGRGLDVEPCWSESGDIIYFVSQRGSTRSIWAQRVDAQTKQPAGRPFLAYAPSSASQTLLSTLPTRRATGLTAAGGRLFFAMDQAESSVWLLKDH